MGYSKDYKSGGNDKDYDRYGSRRNNSSDSDDSWLRPGRDDDEFSSSGSSYDSGSTHDSRYQNWSQDELRSASTSERSDHDLNGDSAYNQARALKPRIQFPNISIGQILMAVLFIAMLFFEVVAPSRSPRGTAQRVPQMSQEAALVVNNADQDLRRLLETRSDLKPDTGRFKQAKAEAYLIQCVIHNRRSSAEFLLRLPLDADIKDARGETLIQIAMNQKYDDMVATLLVSKPNLSATNSLGVGIIHTAAANGYDNVVIAALNQGANPSASAGGGTPLHYAARNGHMNIVKMLLESESDPRITNRYGWYPADVCKDIYPEISQLIIKHGGAQRGR